MTNANFPLNLFAASKPYLRCLVWLDLLLAEAYSGLRSRHLFQGTSTHTLDPRRSLLTLLRIKESLSGEYLQPAGLAPAFPLNRQTPEQFDTTRHHEHEHDRDLDHYSSAQP